LRKPPPGRGICERAARVADQYGRGHRVKVLIVEDDLMQRRALARLLTLEGYAVETAGAVNEASAKLDGQAVALLDLNLPDGLGTDLLKRIREAHPHISVVVLSAAVDALITDAMNLGPDLVVRKPVDVAALLQWLRAWTAQHRTPPPG